MDGLVSKRNSDENTEQSGLNGLLQIFLTELSTFVDHDDGCHFIIAASNKPFNLGLCLLLFDCLEKPKE